MSCYLDDSVTRNAGRWCHLWADTEAELHELARKIYVRRDHFQPHDTLPHYNLKPSKRKFAIEAGAIPTSLRDWIRRRNQKEEWRYRYEERLGMLCAADAPTEDQKAIAEQEANQWLDSVKIALETQPFLALNVEG